MSNLVRVVRWLLFFNFFYILFRLGMHLLCVCVFKCQKRKGFQRVSLKFSVFKLDLAFAFLNAIVH